MDSKQLLHDLLLATYAIFGMAGSALVIVKLYLRRRWKQEDTIEKRRTDAERKQHEKILALEDEKNKLDAARLASFGNKVDRFVEEGGRQQIRMEKFDGRMDRFEAVVDGMLKRFEDFSKLLHKMAEAQLKMYSGKKDLPNGNVRIIEKTGKKP